ncbi:MAG: hypothetical protein ABJA66_00955 [Actinomycetota bacterium]
MKSSKIIFLFILFISLSNVFGQREKPATQAELDEITTRGKMLYEYDVAAWHSTDAVLALSPTEDSFTGYIGKKTDQGWVVAYGKLNDKKDKYLIVYEAVQGAKAEEYKAVKLAKPREDIGFYLNAAKAFDTVQADFKGLNRPYNFAVLPAKDDEFFVYVLPAQTEAEIFPLGGDVRYRISKDGTKVMEKRQMHKSIIEFKVPPPNIKPVTGYHTAILDDVPEDSDVFHVLTRNLNLPELVVSQRFVYRIAPDGTIIYLMTTEAFTKIGKS